MIKTLNKFMQYLGTFNFGIGCGNNLFAATVQIWPFVWGLNVAKNNGVFEARVGPVTVTFATQQK
jgi:hypothetical protein